MEVRRQTCQACGSIDVRNILARKPDEPTMVYVRCAKCGELVAYYGLQDYYHHGKGIESYLRGQGVPADDSGRAWLAGYQKLKQDALSGFEEVLQLLANEKRDV